MLRTYSKLLVLFAWLKCVENVSDVIVKDLYNVSLPEDFHQEQSNKSSIKNENPRKQFSKADKAMFCPSIAQQGEDAILSLILDLLFSIKNNITYLDIGCYRPFIGSNTYRFYRENSSGVIIDANPQYRKENLRLRPRDIFLNIAVVGKSNEKEMLFYPNKQDGTLAKEKAKGIKSITVPVMQINDLLKEYFSGRKLDLMSVDVEGIDEEILMAIDYMTYRPKVIVMESNKVDLSYSQNEIIKFMNLKEYALVADTFINFIFADTTQFKVRKRKKFYTDHFVYNGKRL